MLERPESARFQVQDASQHRGGVASDRNSGASAASSAAASASVTYKAVSLVPHTNTRLLGMYVEFSVQVLC